MSIPMSISIPISISIAIIVAIAVQTWIQIWTTKPALAHAVASPPWAYSGYRIDADTGLGRERARLARAALPR
jgi:hypothetical protein